MEIACGLIPYQVCTHNRGMTQTCQLENTYFLKKFSGEKRVEFFPTLSLNSYYFFSAEGGSAAVAGGSFSDFHSGAL